MLLAVITYRTRMTASEARFGQRHRTVSIVFTIVSIVFTIVSIVFTIVSIVFTIVSIVFTMVSIVFTIVSIYIYISNTVDSRDHHHTAL